MTSRYILCTLRTLEKFISASKWFLLQFEKEKSPEILTFMKKSFYLFLFLPIPILETSFNSFDRKRSCTPKIYQIRNRGWWDGYHHHKQIRCSLYEICKFWSLVWFSTILINCSKIVWGVSLGTEIAALKSSYRH